MIVIGPREAHEMCTIEITSRLGYLIHGSNICPLVPCGSGLLPGCQGVDPMLCRPGFRAVRPRHHEGEEELHSHRWVSTSVRLTLGFQ